VSDGETQRCQERCQKETTKIHSGKKKGQAGEKNKKAAVINRIQSRIWYVLLPNFRAEWDGKHAGTAIVMVVRHNRDNPGLAGFRSIYDKRKL
jgi:hypothetical protein